MKAAVCVLVLAVAAMCSADEKKTEKRGLGLGYGLGGGLGYGLGHGYGLAHGYGLSHGYGLGHSYGLGHGYYGNGLGLYNHGLGLGGLDYYGGLGHGLGAPVHSLAYSAPLLPHAPLLHGWH